MPTDAPKHYWQQHNTNFELVSTTSQMSRDGIICYVHCLKSCRYRYEELVQEFESVHPSHNNFFDRKILVRQLHTKKPIPRQLRTIGRAHSETPSCCTMLRCVVSRGQLPKKQFMGLLQQHQHPYPTFLPYERMVESVCSLLVSDNRGVFGGISKRMYIVGQPSFAQEQLTQVLPNLFIDQRSTLIVHSSSGKSPRATTKPNKTTVLASKESIDEKDANNIVEVSDDSNEIETGIQFNDITQYAIPLPDRLHVDIYTLFPTSMQQIGSDGRAVAGTIWLNETIFGRDPIRVDLIKRAVDYYRAKKRGIRKAKTKTIHEVSGSGRKLRKQKGLGRARVGHSRPPHFRGGAKAHGPKNVTDYGNTKLNRHVRKLALVHALSQKLLEGNLIIINHLHELPTHKTADLTRRLKPYSTKTILLIDHYFHAEDNNVKATPHFGLPRNVWLASRNIASMQVGNDHSINVYDILKYEKLIMTIAAIREIEARLNDL